MTIERFGSGGPWEDSVGYSRAVRCGPFVMTAGCTSFVDGELTEEGDPYAQAKVAFGVAVGALESAGCSVEDVVQTRMYLAHIRDADEVGRAHAEIFGHIRPAATMVAVNAFVLPRMLVEVEVVAYRPGSG